MAWSTPATWVAGAVLTAAQLNAQLRDNLNAAFPLGAPDVAWTTYTPTLVQSGAVAKTVTWGRYTKIGRTVHAQVFLAVTGPGTAGNAVGVGLPVLQAANDLTPFGTGYIYDTSAGAGYPGIAIGYGSSVVAFRPASEPSANLLGVAVFAAALASGDEVYINVTYQAAT